MVYSEKQSSLIVINVDVYLRQIKMITNTDQIKEKEFHGIRLNARIVVIGCLKTVN